MGEEPEADDAEGEQEVRAMDNATAAEKAKMMVTCKHAIFKRWSNSMEEIGDHVNATIASSFDESNESAPQLNYSEATRALAVAQLASCARTVTLADVEADNAGTLSETA